MHSKSLRKLINRVENRACISQFLRGPLSSLRHAILYSATHEKADAWVSSNFLLLFSSPIINSCLERDWFLLPWSCWEITLFCTRTVPTTHSFIHLFTEYHSCAKFCAWYHGEGKVKSARIWTATLPRGSWVVRLQSSMLSEKTHETNREEKIGLKSVMAVSGRCPTEEM